MDKRKSVVTEETVLFVERRPKKEFDCACKNCIIYGYWHVQLNNSVFWRYLFCCKFIPDYLRAL